MNVKQILAQKGLEIISAKSGMRVADAANLLAERRIGAVPVMDGKQLIGILSERDIIRGIASNGSRILDEAVDVLMTKSLFTCGPMDKVDDLMTLMTERKIRHLPVLENDSMIGMISIGDVVKEKISESEQEAEALKSYIASA